MRILFLGDIMGRAGRDAVIAAVPGLRAEFALDLLVVNAENAAHGRGLNSRICEDLYAAGVDAITTGNHVFDQKELIGYIDSDPRLVRPMNFPEDTPGRGHTIVTDAAGRRLLVINAIARLFMEANDNPFAAIDRLLKTHRLGHEVDAILVDFHGEASSEKQSLGWHLDGRVSIVVGTHTHVPTADGRILKRGTAYQTDAGMCGDYDSIIGMKVESSINRFLKRTPGEKMEPAEGPATLCGLLVETDDSTGLATSVRMIRRGGALGE